MAEQQNFRSAFNGFNREDVARYLEYVNTKYNNQVNQLTAEVEELRTRLSHQADEGQLFLLDELQKQCEELTAQLEASEAKNAQLEARCAELEQQQGVRTAAPTTFDELEAYRRAERAEREAKERADLVYYQANGVLSEATSKVESISAEITDMADQVMTQLTQLQIAVSSSKQALQDASSIMSIIRPNK